MRDGGPLDAPLALAAGHGLGLVNTVAARWEARSLAAGGKLIWAELASPAAGGPAAAARAAESAPSAIHKFALLSWGSRLG